MTIAFKLSTVWIGVRVAVEVGCGVRVSVGMDVAIPDVEVPDILVVGRFTGTVDVKVIGTVDITELHDKITVSANT